MWNSLNGFNCCGTSAHLLAHVIMFTLKCATCNEDPLFLLDFLLITVCSFLNWKKNTLFISRISVRPSTPFSADTDTPIFCCQSNTIPIRYRFFYTLQERTWRRVTDRSKAPDAAAATNNSGAPRTHCSAAADAFDLSWTVKHSNYQ